MNKTCRLCGLNKSVDDFYFRKDRNTYRTECKNCIVDIANKNHDLNRNERLLKMKQYQKLNKSKLLDKSRQYYADNKDTVLEHNKLWRKAFRDIHGVSYNNFRYNNDLNHKLKCIIRNRIADALKANNLSLIHVDVGCSTEFLISYLESKWQPEMTWDNWSRDGWHVDHIVPLHNFDLSNKEEFNKACNYKNLQPLWAKDNWYKNRDRTNANLAQ